MGAVSGPINCFIVEPFVPHDEEYYLCIQSRRTSTDISFSEAGGMEIEENWDQVRGMLGEGTWGCGWDGGIGAKA